MPTKSTKAVALRVSHHATAASLGFDVTIKRSPRRRTLEIIIRRGQVLLMLPQFVSNREGFDFIERKRQWIADTLQRQREKTGEVSEKQYRQGEVFQFLGRPYTLLVTEGKRNAAALEGDHLRVQVSAGRGSPLAERVRKCLWQWYQAEAMSLLGKKTDLLCAQIGRTHEGVVLRKTKTKWGHCTRSGVIQYNWQIMCAPEAIIDYLVAHEVSHLVHHNHSRLFWQQVEALCPDYRERRLWLKTHGHSLEV